MSGPQLHPWNEPADDKPIEITFQDMIVVKQMIEKGFQFRIYAGKEHDDVKKLHVRISRLIDDVYKRQGKPPIH